jgi:hypothetical protein
LRTDYFGGQLVASVRGAVGGVARDGVDSGDFAVNEDHIYLSVTAKLRLCDVGSMKSSGDACAGI